MLSCKSSFKLHASRHTFMHCLHLHSCLLLSFFPPNCTLDHNDDDVIISIMIIISFFFFWQYDWGLVIGLTWLSCHFIPKLAAGLRQSSCQTALRRCVQPTDAYTHTNKTSISPWSPLMSVSPDCVLDSGVFWHVLLLPTSKHKQIKHQSPGGNGVPLQHIPRVSRQQLLR